MAQNQLMQSFEVRNSDVCIKFNCPNHKKRIQECIQNLQINLQNEESLTKKEAFLAVTERMKELVDQLEKLLAE